MEEKKSIYDKLKDVVGLASGIGVGAIMACAVTHVTAGVSLSLLRRLCVPIGGFMLGCMASDRVQDYTDEKIDETAESVQNFLNKHRPVQESEE